MMDKEIERSIETAFVAFKKLSWILSTPQNAAMLNDLAALLKTYSAAAMENWKKLDENQGEGH